MSLGARTRPTWEPRQEAGRDARAPSRYARCPVSPASKSPKVRQSGPVEGAPPGVRAPLAGSRHRRGRRGVHRDPVVDPTPVRGARPHPDPVRRLRDLRGRPRGRAHRGGNHGLVLRLRSLVDRHDLPPIRTRRCGASSFLPARRRPWPSWSGCSSSGQPGSLPRPRGSGVRRSGASGPSSTRAWRVPCTRCATDAWSSATGPWSSSWAAIRAKSS